MLSISYLEFVKYFRTNGIQRSREKKLHRPAASTAEHKPMLIYVHFDTPQHIGIAFGVIKAITCRYPPIYTLLYTQHSAHHSLYVASAQQDTQMNRPNVLVAVPKEYDTL